MPMTMIGGGPKQQAKPEGDAEANAKPAEDEKPEAEGGARKAAVKAIASALGSENADLESLDKALMAYVESCGSY